MKTLKTLLILLSTVLFFTACKKDESTSLWNISGKVSLKDAEVESITSPMEGVEVYLFNFPFTMDSTTSWFSREGILDSALTNNNGVYNFKLVAPGDYFVYPSDNTKSYDFDWEESSHSFLIDRKNTNSDYEINFSALQKIPENSDGVFEFIFDSRGSSDLNSIDNSCNIAILRKTRTWEAYWDGWVPKVGWGDWYYKVVEGWEWHSPGQNLSFDFEVYKDASGILYQYEDEFKIKFSIYPTIDAFLLINDNTIRTLDMTLDDFSGYSNSSNKWCRFDVNWVDFQTVEVTRNNNRY